MTEKAVRIEQRSREEAIPLRPRDDLAAVKVSSENQVVGVVTRGLPNARVMGAQDSYVPVPVSTTRVIRPRDRDRPLAVRKIGGIVVNPAAAAFDDGIADAIDADPTVMIAANGEGRRDLDETGDEIAQVRNFRALVDEIAAEKYEIRLASSSGLEHLSAQRVRPAVPEMNIADVEQPARVAPRREPFLADVQRASEPDFKRPGGYHRRASHNIKVL